VSDGFATEVDLPAPPEEVFRHLTDPAAMVRWMGQHATLEPIPGLAALPPPARQRRRRGDPRP
jgi:uncharacterized protein YndB with AHSA1/START domain